MPRYLEFEVSLLEIKPRIWRRFQLVASSSFETLHDAIQDAFAWQRKHLYEFRHAGDISSHRTKSVHPVRTIARCEEAEILDDQIVPFASDLKLTSFFAKKEDCCLYLYDFGDGWQHLVKLKDIVESNQTFERRLITGAMACPPENVGGAPGYEQMLETLALSDDHVAGLDEAERPEVEWLRDKYRDWKPDGFEIEPVRLAFDS